MTGQEPADTKCVRGNSSWIKEKKFITIRTDSPKEWLNHPCWSTEISAQRGWDRVELPKTRPGFLHKFDLDDH